MNRLLRVGSLGGRDCLFPGGEGGKGPAAEQVSTSMQNTSLGRVLANALKTSVPAMNINNMTSHYVQFRENKKKNMGSKI